MLLLYDQDVLAVLYNLYFHISASANIIPTVLPEPVLLISKIELENYFDSFNDC